MAGSTPPRVVVADPPLPVVEMDAMDAIEGVSERWRLRVRGRGGRGVDSAGRLGGGLGFLGRPLVVVGTLSPGWRSGVGRVVLVVVAGEFVPLREPD